VPRRVSTINGKWQRIYRRLRPEHVLEHNGIRVAVPALTAVDLACQADGGKAVDEVLRARAADLATLREALAAYPSRDGNLLRLRILDDSRDNPWSEGERELHRLLRAEGIAGWVANAWISCKGENFYADVLFRSSRLIVEFDGWEYHHDREAFERDRRRRNELELAGYLVLNFTWRHLIDDPEWVTGCIRRAIDGRRRSKLSRMAYE
jgi:very-short-patch-repair endonuclease